LVSIGEEAASIGTGAVEVCVTIGLRTSFTQMFKNKKRGNPEARGASLGEKTASSQISRIQSLQPKHQQISSRVGKKAQRNIRQRERLQNLYGQEVRQNVRREPWAAGGEKRERGVVFEAQKKRKNCPF